MSLLLEHYRTFGPADRGTGDTGPTARGVLATGARYLPARGSSHAPLIDIVIPVHNEVHSVAASVSTLHAHLQSTLPSTFRITVADNASTDGTWTVVSYLNRTLDSVAGVHLPLKGRGRALRATWSASDARVLAYMDVDLSTDLGAVLPLLAPLLSEHSDLAIGSRLARGARTVRGRKRDLISRSYNAVLHATLRAAFSDAQCGFKAITADAAQLLLPLIEDNGWFFDTELLVLAERAGLRIHEVPVDWIDDPDSRVDILDTAVKDLQGVWRLSRTLRSGRLPLAEIGSRLRPTVLPRSVTGPPVALLTSPSRRARPIPHLPGADALTEPKEPR
jgi:glycosyltransferase involved in cell wall biosynthesis